MEPTNSVDSPYYYYFGFDTHSRSVGRNQLHPARIRPIVYFIYTFQFSWRACTPADTVDAGRRGVYSLACIVVLCYVSSIFAKLSLSLDLLNKTDTYFYDTFQFSRGLCMVD